MRQALQNILLVGTALMVFTGTASAKTGSPQAPAAQSNQGFESQSYSGRGRFAERFMAEFDMNKDGKVTHDEFNRTLAREFAEATKGAPTMSAEQFAGLHLKDLRERASVQFHQTDWNGDGKITLEEYMVPERDRFEFMDREGSGAVSCGSSRGDGQFGGAGGGQRGGSSGGSSRGFGSRGRSSLCFAADLDHDGKVTRAEFEKYSEQQFNAFAKGGSLNLDQYIQLQAAQSRAISARVFQRLDRDRDGKLTLAEFAASQEKLFARLDKKGDGVITEDELTTSRRGRVASRN
jgi:Ca2+-binding EF-hand superfamily protein